MRRSAIKSFFILCIVVIVGGGIMYSIGLWEFAHDARRSATAIQDNFKSAGSALFAFDLAGANEAFHNAYQQLTGLKDKSDTYFLTTFIKELSHTLNDLGTLTLLAIDLTARTETIKNNSLHWIMSGHGSQLIDELRTIHERITQLLPLLTNLRQQAVQLGYNPPADLGTIIRQLTQSDQMLSALLPWLESREPHHVAILLQNNSEIRPAGGFLGSFVDATISRGGLAAMEVHDIYNVDGQLQKKIVPPRPLQGLTATWGARDTNWFFDFPTSARKVSELLAASRVYAEKQISFDAVLAINPNVLRSILALTGPITIAEYNLTIDADTFLSLLQREVESGVDNQAGQPKKIFTVLTPLLIEKIGQFSDDQKKELLLRLGYHFTHKNIQAYFVDPLIEQYLRTLGVAGDMVIENNFNNSDYLAVATANVAGGKTDTFMEQKIALKSSIDDAGHVINIATIDRQYLRTNATDPWYAKDNKVWLDLMTPLGSDIQSVVGGEKRIIRPPTHFHTPSLLQKNMFGKNQSRQFLPIPMMIRQHE